MLRIIKDKLFVLLLASIALTGILTLATIFIFIFVKGLPAIDIEFLTTESRDFGAQGGILYQLLGSIIIISGAGVVALPIALGTAVYQYEYINPSLRRISNLMIYALNGVPSIIFGLFGLVFFAHNLGLGISWLSGSLILGTMILPTIIVSIKESFDSLPVIYKESAWALGLSRWQVIRSVLIPQSLSGIITGLLLGLARAGGETAPIMFTATCFSGVLLPHSFSEPVTTLPTHILYLAQEASNPVTLTNGWGASVVLIIFICIMSISSMIIRTRFKTIVTR
ncbi:MAG: phosphate ABC transporter permease PstA [Nitrospinae bacterium]|nr:phosphate ABC transporter permease PstA [Nitrospinota bacterium]